MPGLRQVDDSTFADLVLAADRPVVVEFWAPWCGPCRAVAPVVQELAQTYGDRVSFVGLDVDESPATAARYDVLSIPTLVLFENGEPRDAQVGARSRSHLERAWAPWLGGGSRSPSSPTRRSEVIEARGGDGTPTPRDGDP